MVAKIFQLARACAFAHPQFFSHQIKLYHPDGPMGWTTVVQYDFSRNMYSRAQSKKYDFPMMLSTRLAKIGKTSLDFISYIHDKSDNEYLASLRFKYVLVSRETRKAAAVPSAFKNAFEQYTPSNLGVDNVVFPKRPQNAQSIYHKLRPSNIDHNGHLNNAYYLILCYDCATVVSVNQKVFRKFDGDICYYNTKQLIAQYMGESRLVDGEVVVYCWQDDKQDYVLHFNIEKAQKVIFQSSIVFYNQQAHTVSKL